MASAPAGLSIFAHGRPCGWTPVSRIPQPGPASRPPTVCGCSPCDASLCPGFTGVSLDRASTRLVPLTSAIAIFAFVFLLALLVFANARRRILESGIPEGRVVYQDTDSRRSVERPLVSHRYGLTGKPDYLVEQSNELIPVEVKSRSCPPSGPHASDAAQLTAYCVLVEDFCGVTPSHGVIQYANRSWPIRYTFKGRERLLEILDEMRAARHSDAVHRDHIQAGRCRACGYRAACNEALD